MVEPLYIPEDPPKPNGGYITEKQRLILEYAYGNDCPDFDQPPRMSAREIAKLTGAGLAYVKNILRDKYLRKRNIKYIY